MNTNTILASLQRDIINNVPLLALLEKSGILAHYLKAEKMEIWVKSELNGYEDYLALPKYRILKPGLYATLSDGIESQGGYQVPISYIPEENRDNAQSVFLKQGISTLEEYIKTDQDISVRISPEFVAWFNNTYPALYGENVYVTNMYRPLTKGDFVQILSTVKSILIDFILELAQEWDFSSAQQPHSGQVERLLEKIIIVNTQGGPMTTGDQFNITGVTGNVVGKAENSHFTQTINTINQIPHTDDANKKALEFLIKQLETELAKVPKEQKEAAEVIEEQTKKLVEYAGKEKPNRSLIELTSDGLKKAAENIETVLPRVFSIATQIVAWVLKVVPK